MSHKAIESFAIQPHNIEASRVETLMPEQLRENARTLLDLLTEYYNYMNIDGVVNGISIVDAGDGEELGYEDLVKSKTKLGIKVTGFVPSTYNQLYVKLTDEEILNNGYPATVVYQGVTNDAFVIMKVDTKNNREVFRDTWVMAKIIDNITTVDFYDRDWQQNDPKGSNSENLQIIRWRENVGGSLTTADTTASSAYISSKEAGAFINPIGMTDAQIPQKTSLINFEDIPVKGGHGQDLTVDIIVDLGKVVSIVPNQPGFGYRMDDLVEIDGALPLTLFSISEVIASPSNVVRRIIDEHDIDKTTEEYLSRIAKEIANSIPEAKNLDRNYLYKKIVEYYNTRGSQDSIQSFFKIFFDTIGSVEYPKDQLFKASDGDYRGTASVSESLAKYFYKKGYDNGRRISFYKKPEFGNITKGTYFIDFEFGADFERNAVAPSTLSAEQTEAYKFTPLFSGSNAAGTELTLGHLRNMGFKLKIDTDGDLLIAGTIGSTANKFDIEFANYALGTNTNPFLDTANLGLKKVRLAISIDASNSAGLQASSVKVAMSNSGETDNAPVTIINDASGTGGRKMNFVSGALASGINLYPGAIGQISNDIDTGDESYIPENQNPNSDLYVSTFSFYDRLCTDDEMKNFVNDNTLPVNNRIVDVDFDNNGSVNFTNKDSQILLATQVEGVVPNGTGEKDTAQAPISETNYGLSSTGSEYPRRISWNGVKGFLSSSMKLHDSNYYQEFSYVIRTDISVDRWETEYQKLIHPAGLKFFTALYLELASERVDNDEPKNLNFLLGEGVRYWLAAIQGEVTQGSHTPKWQPGWLEYFFNVLLEIIVYEQYAHNNFLQQPQLNRLKDTYYNHDRGLRLKQFDTFGRPTTDNSAGYTLRGNAKQSIIENILPLTYDSKYIRLDGEGTGIKTGGKIDKSSVLELTFKLNEEGDTANGSYVAGCQYPGIDGANREISIKQIRNNGTKKRVEVLVTDNDAQASAAEKADILSFKVIGSQLDNNSIEQGVYFSDTTVTQSNAAGQFRSTTGDNTSNNWARGHNLVIFDPSAKTYETYTFDTYSGTNQYSSPSTPGSPLQAQKDLTDKIATVAAGKICIVYTHDASSCTLGTGGIREYIANNRTNHNVGTNDRYTEWTGHRTAHVIVIQKGADSTSDKIWERTQESIGGAHATDIQKKAIQPELSFHYTSAGVVTQGPFIGEGKNALRKPVLTGNPVIIECSESGTNNELGYTKLTVNANGEVRQYNYTTTEYEIKRSKEEAGDTKLLPLIDTSGFDYIPQLNSNRGNVSLSNFIQSGEPVVGFGGNQGYYYDETLDGVVVTGTNKWVQLQNNTLIDHAATYEVTTTVKNLLDVPNKIYISVESLTDVGGSTAQRDIHGTFNYAIPTSGTNPRNLAPGEEVTLTFQLGGYNPYNSRENQQQSVGTEPYRYNKYAQDESSSTPNSFDPDTKAFNIGFISNYHNWRIKDQHPNITDTSPNPNPPHKAATLFKSFTIKKTNQNKLVENHAISKIDPAFGFNNILTNSLPAVDVAGIGSNNTFINTLALGTINVNKKLAGVHEVDVAPSSETNLLKSQNFLPLKAGHGTFDPTGSGSTRDWRFFDQGANAADRLTSEAVREYKPGPFGHKEIVINCEPSDDTGNSHDGGYYSPPVSIDNLSDYRFTHFFKYENTGSNAYGSSHTIYFGLYSTDDNRTTKSVNRKRKNDFDIGSSTTTSNAYFKSFKPSNNDNGALQPGRWYLAVGYATGRPVSPGTTAQGESNGNHRAIRKYLDSGFYDAVTGEKVSTNIFLEWINQDANITRVSIRGLQAGNDPKTGHNLQFARPRIEKMDGTQPTIKQLLSPFFEERTKLNSNIQFSDVYLNGSNKEDSIKYLITESDKVGNSFGRISSDSPNHNPIPSTESSTAYSPVSYTDAKVISPSLKNIVALGGDDGLILERTGIKSIGAASDKSNTQTSMDSSRLNSLLFTIKDGDYTVVNASGADKTSEVSGLELNAFFSSLENDHVKFNVINSGKGFDEHDVITIAKAKIGNPTNDVKIKVKEVGRGEVQLEQNSSSAIAENRLYLTRASNDSPSKIGLNGSYTTDKFEWETDKSYEISFNATKIFDRNTPANLYIGTEKIGHFFELPGQTGKGTGNPNVLLGDRARDGDGPHDIVFNSSIEGRCRIVLVIGEANGHWRLAHNGHQLRVDNTNSDGIDIENQPDDYWNRGTTKLKNPAESEETHPDGDANRFEKTYGQFVFESEFLTIGENVIQLYNSGPADDLRNGGYLYVQPADNGLITEGSNTHKIYIPQNSTDNKITIDHRIDRDVNRTLVNADAPGLQDYLTKTDKTYEYSWKLENIKVREKRKRVYDGNFRCIVGSPTDFTGKIWEAGNNPHPDFGTNQYKPIDVTSVNATDGAIGYGGDLIVPALVNRASFIAEDVGQEYNNSATTIIDGTEIPVSGGAPVLGVPRGKYGVLKLTASSVGTHYISVGDNYEGTPFTKNGLYKAGEIYEISGYAFIPTSNTKIEQVHIMAGVNPRATNEDGSYALTFDSPNDTIGNYTFKNAIGKHQITTGTQVLGYDAYGTQPTFVGDFGYSAKVVGATSGTGLTLEELPDIPIQQNWTLEFPTNTYNLAIGGTGISTSGSGTAAEFTITRGASAYTSVFTNKGDNFVVNDTITIPGSQLNAADSTNNATITVSETSKTFSLTHASTGVSTNDTGTSYEFTVVRTGSTYAVTFSNEGTGFDAGDTITVLGSALGGTDTTHDLTITIQSAGARLISGTGNANAGGEINNHSISGTPIGTVTVSSASLADNATAQQSMVLDKSITVADDVILTMKAPTIKGSWQFFEHTFTAPAYVDDEFPVVRFVGTLKDEALRGFAGYTGDATGEYFYIKNLVIKEGYNTDGVKNKEALEENQKLLLSTKDKVDYDISLNTLETNKEACVAIDLKYPADTNTYEVKYNNVASLGSFNLNTLTSRESNLLASYLPFASITPATGDYSTGIINPNRSYRSQSSEDTFITFGNPVSQGTNPSNLAPYKTTNENEIIVDAGPFGGAERIWRAKNLDGAWAQLVNKDSSGIESITTAGTQYGITYTNPTYELSAHTFSGVTHSHSGSGTGSVVNVTNTNGVYTSAISGTMSGFEGPIAYVNPSTFHVTSTGGSGFGNTNAVITVTHTGTIYNVTFTNKGTGYAVGDSFIINGSALGNPSADSPSHNLNIIVSKVSGTGQVEEFTQTGNPKTSNTAAGDTITIAGTQLGGASPANDATIKVKSVNSSGSIVEHEITGTGHRGGLEFTVRRGEGGTTYGTPVFSSAGSGLQTGQTILVKGDQLGGATPTNDLTITPVISAGAVASSSVSGTADTTFENIEIEDTQTGNAGVGALATITVGSTGNVTKVDITNGGINYGKQSNGTYTSSAFNVAIKSGQTFDKSGGGTAFAGTAKINYSATIATNGKVLSFADGGFKTPPVIVDPSKSYRVSMWVRQSDVRFSAGQAPFSATDGGLKIIRWVGYDKSLTKLPQTNITSTGNAAPTDSTVCNFIADFDLLQSSATSSNPAGNDNKDKWCLFVGHIRPFDHPGTTDHPDSGIYIPSSDGIKAKSLVIGNNRGDWKFNAGTAEISITGLHNANPLSTEDPVDFYAPRIDELNGLEPTIAELTSGKVLYKNDANDLEKKLQLINWNNTITDATENIGEYNHIIQGDDFNIAIDEVVNEVEYADSIDGTLISKGAPEDTLIEIELPGALTKGSATGIVLPILKEQGTSPITHAATIDWGDGSSNFIKNDIDADLYHQYPTQTATTRYTIKISGQFNRINAEALDTTSTSTSRLAYKAIAGSITDTIVDAGYTNFKTMIRKVYLGASKLEQPSGTGKALSFNGCTGLTHFITKKGIPNTSELTHLNALFKGCTNLKHIDVSGLDTSNVTSMKEAFTNLGTGVTLIGFHKLDISSISAATTGGNEIDFTGTTFNSDELSRCYQAWGNNIFCTVPTAPLGKSTSPPDGSTGNILAKVGRITFKKNSNASSGTSFPIKEMKIGSTTLVATGLSTAQIATNLSTGMTITSSAANFPSSATTITGFPSLMITMSQAPSGNLNMGTFITHVPQIGDTKIAVKDIAGTLEVGMSISGTGIPANTTIASVITPAGTHGDVVRIITLSNALTAIPANGATLTIAEATGIKFNMGSTKYFESDTTNTPIANARTKLTNQTSAGGNEIDIRDGGAETGSFDF